MTEDKLFDNIREGDEVKAKERFDRLRETALRGAISAIMARNSSHGIGKHVLG